MKQRRGTLILTIFVASVIFASAAFVSGYFLLPNSQKDKQPSATAQPAGTTLAQSTKTLPTGSAEAEPLKAPTDSQPILKNLSIKIEPWDKTTNKAGDLLFQGRDHVDDKLFFEFGYKIVNDMGEKLLPEIGFNLPVGTPVVSPLDGFVSDIKFYEPAQDYIIFIKTRATSPWIVGLEHIYNLTVKKDEPVLAGQKIAEVSPSYGKTEFGNLEINVWTGGQTITKYCPTDFLADSLKPVYQEKLDRLARDWGEFTGKDIYRPEDWVAPGCLAHVLNEA